MGRHNLGLLEKRAVPSNSCTGFPFNLGKVEGV
jgi:hypothetical protein